MNKEARENFIKTFYLKAKGSVTADIKPEVVGQLLGFNQKITREMVSYFSSKGMVDTTKGYGGAIRLTSHGVDYVDELKEGKTFKRIQFIEGRYLNHPTRSAYGFLFWYNVYNDDESVSHNRILVYVSDVLMMNWGLHFQSGTDDVEKILLQVAKNTVFEKLKEGTLNENEELFLMTSNSPDQCPFAPENLVRTKDAEYEVQIGNKVLAQEIAENKLAASIIETRDTINALFKIKYKCKFLLLNQERNLLDLFKSATSTEEFSHRVTSLGQMSRYLNEDFLRTATGETNKEIKSIGLLEQFFTSIGKMNPLIVDTLRQIGRMRNGYPAHTDEIPDVIKAYRHFDIPYPVENFEMAWITLLNRYLEALKAFSQILQSL